jgi:hypothetical protein
MDCNVIVEVERTPGGPAVRLANAWVYWKVGSTITALRSNDRGMLYQLRPSGVAVQPWDYTQLFVATVDDTVELHFGRGARPTPSARLADNAAAFVSKKVTVPPPGPQTPSVPTPIAANSLNTLSALPIAVVRLPPSNVHLTKPTEVAVWPLLWTAIDPDTYATDGLPQGAAAWGPNAPLVHDGAPAPAPNAVRPKERGLVVTGTMDGKAQGVQVQIIGADDAFVQLRTSPTATANVPAINATLGAKAGDDVGFSANIWFANAAQAFGSIQILVKSTGGVTPAAVDSYYCVLGGLQIALSTDSNDGTQAGTAPTEANELYTIDFDQSPQQSVADLSDQSRVRRMAAYPIRIRSRPLSAANATAVVTPEMPLWMAECHLHGVSRKDIEALLAHRRFLGTSSPPALALQLGWTLNLSWDGPDAGPLSPRGYRYQMQLASQSTARLTLEGDADTIANVGADGAVPKALTPEPVALTFPVQNRRTASVQLDQARPWGRKAGATSRPSLVVGWQPAVAINGVEKIRGGDGLLSLTSVNIDGTAPDAGVLETGAAATGAAATLPRFRIPGTNPPHQPHGLSPDLTTLVNALVEEYYNAHATVASVNILDLAVWQGTLRPILGHEGAGRHFDDRGVARRRYAGQYFGHEAMLPLFGPPHGYGTGQLDNPPATDDQVWSHVDNIRGSVALLMGAKASQAYGALSAHFAHPPARRDKAVFRREVVRQYNGGREFRWNAAAARFEINPSLAQWANPANHAEGPNPRLNYPNNVLGTGVVYYNGAGAATTFPWPIAFAEADFGPDI